MSAPTLRQHLLAALVLAHVAVMWFGSIPLPPRALAEGKPHEKVEDAIAWWGERLEVVGVPLEVSDPAIRSVGGVWTAGLFGLREALKPYTTTFGVLQGWSMFGRVPRDSALPEIEVRRRGRWEPLYVARSDEHAWRRAFFDHDRTRTWLHEAGYQGSRKAWKRFADWTLREVREEHPDVEEVRVQLRKIEIPPPDELRVAGELRRAEALRVERRKP